MSRRTIAVLTAVLCLGGTILVCLSVADAILMHQRIADAAGRYLSTVSALEDSAVRKQKNLARWFNYNISASDPEEGFESGYDGLLRLPGDLIGYVQIPRLGDRILLYHGASADKLGMKHQAASALPVGGRGNHSVFSSDGVDSQWGEMVRLEQGNLIFLYILDEVHVYEVAWVREYRPETSARAAKSEGDLLTLSGFAMRGGETVRIEVRCVRIDPELESDAVASLSEVPVIDKSVLITALASALAAGLLPAAARSLAIFGGWIWKLLNCDRFTKNRVKIACFPQEDIDFSKS